MPYDRARANTTVLPEDQWNELHDYLTLALDSMGARPDTTSCNARCMTL